MDGQNRHADSEIGSTSNPRLTTVEEYDPLLDP
jgi:hypothetical protein